MSATYVLDTNSFRVFGNYYPESFPSFWDQVEQLAVDGMLVSCSEVAKELNLQSSAEHLIDWVESHPQLFPDPTEAEMEYVAEIFRVLKRAGFDGGHYLTQLAFSFSSCSA